MAQDIISATDALLGAITTAWTNNTPAVTGTVPTLVFESLERDLKPHPADSVDPWARAVVRHGSSPATSIRGPAAVKLYWRSGMVWVQIFVPNKDARAWTVATMLGKIAQQAYQGKALGDDGSITFNRVDVREQGVEGAWYRVDMQAYFRYPELA